MSFDEKVAQIPLKTREYTYLNKTIQIKYADTIDGLVDEMTSEDFGDDERFPYFLTIWESGTYLAEYIISNVSDLNNKTILELGSGTGLTGVLLSSFCKKIIMTDYEPFSVELCKNNAMLNKVDNYESVLGDWRQFPKLNEKIDILIAADVLYESKQVKPLVSLILEYVKKGAVAYLADPGRNYLEECVALFRDALCVVTQVSSFGLRTELAPKVSIFKISY